MNSDISEVSKRKNSFYRRIESRLLHFLPVPFTPLRFRIVLGYMVVLLLGVYNWEQITSAWSYFATLMTPIVALLGALVALKVSVVMVSLVTLFSALLKLFVGFLLMVIKPGILKAILIPQLMSLASWFHRKSSRVQALVKKCYLKLKALLDRVLEWWNNQAMMDKILLSGFIVPLLLVVLIVFVVKRAIAIFTFKKVTEQVVQKSTTFILKNFYRIPIIGGVPSIVAARVRKLTSKEDRNIVAGDLRKLGRELFGPLSQQSQQPDQVDTVSTGTSANSS